MSSHSQSWFQPVRRCANRLFGSGPVTFAPFAEIAAIDRDYQARGIYGREALSGLVHSEPGDAVRYRPTPNLLGQTFPPGVTSGVPGYRDDPVVPLRAKSLFVLQDAGVMGNQGFIYCRRSRRAVAETALQWQAPARHHPLLGAAGFPKATGLSGVSFSVLTRSGESFFHFIHEALPRLQLLGDFRTRIDHFIVNGPPDSFARVWLERAGVPLARVVWAGPLTHFHCEQLLFTSELNFDHQPTPWNIRASRTTIGCPSLEKPGHRRIWVSRKSGYTRHLQWEDELMRALPDFERHDLGLLAPAEQLALFAEAAVLAGPHGAGLANIAFCPPGTKLIELFGLLPMTPLYARWAQLAGAQPWWGLIDFERPSALPELVAAVRRVIDSR